jgi:hypothetical protein
MLTEKQVNGIYLEKPVSWFSEDKLKLGDKVDHNRFDEQYGMDNHLIVDMAVKGECLAECTNPKQTTWMDDDIMENKLDYFRRADPHHFLVWFLIVSFANFSDAIKQQIKKMGIVLIELGVHADKNNFWEIIKRLFHTRLYSFITKTVKQKLARPSKFLIDTIQSILYPSSLPVTSIPVVVSTQSALLTTNRNHLHQHQLSIEEEYSQYEKDMRESFNIWSVHHPKHKLLMVKLTG